MTWYKTGTISLTNGAAAITGAGTSWVDAGVLNSGDILAPPDGNLYEILSIESNTGLTLASNYLGSTASGAAYAIMPIGLLPSALAQQVKAVLTIASAASSAAVLSTPAQGLTSTQQGNARANIAALGAADVGAGRLSKSVAGGADVTLTATEAANQFLDFTGTLTANINVIVPAAARLFAVYNATSGAYTLTVKTAAGTGVAVPQGLRGLVECDATNVVGLTVGNAGSFTTLASTGHMGITTPATVNSVLTLGANVTDYSLMVYDAGSFPYGFGVRSSQMLQYVPTGGKISWGLMSAIPAGTFTEWGYINASGMTTPGAIAVTGPSSTLGYGTGSGGTVTQATSKSTAVTLNKGSGQITMHNEALAGGAIAGFQFNNSLIAATDVVNVSASFYVAGGYEASVYYVAAGYCLIQVRNNNAGSLSDAVVINFAIVKGATS